MARGDRRLAGIRGATALDEHEATDPIRVLEATRELLEELAAANGFTSADVVSAFFTVTADLQVAFPAEAARMLGWRDVPLMCGIEIDVPGSLTRCIRVLLHVQTSAAVHHVYLRRARGLRPDLHYD